MCDFAFTIKLPKEHRHHAFTLTELLVVMAIILVIAGLAVPALKGTFSGTNLVGATDVVTGQMIFARQAAISRNATVEVRIYKYDAGSGSAWNTIGVLVPALVSGRATDEWIEPARTLSGNIIMDPTASASGDAFSTLIAKASTNTAPTKTAPTAIAPWSGTESDNAPGFLKKLNYVGFRFLPDGSTNLPAGLPWCLSLRFASVPVTKGDIPAPDYAAVLIDPFNGRTIRYRP